MRFNMKNESTHFSEQELSLYILKAPEIQARASAIRRHLKKCTGCANLHAQLSEYYQEFQDLQNKVDTEIQPALVPQRALQTYVSKQKLQTVIQQTFQRWFSTSLRYYPYRWTFGFLMAISALLFIIFRQPSGTIQDTNPAYARAKEEFLVVYNNRGDELWKKHVGIGYDYDRYHGRSLYVSIDNFIKTVDVNNDGINEVIAIYGWEPRSVSEKKKIVVCYNNDGSERWVYEFHRTMTFGDELFTDDYQLSKMMVISSSSGSSWEVVVIAAHFPYYPSAILTFDADKGVLVNEYWNSGILDKILSYDIDKDEQKDIIICGTNNAYNNASIIVFDPMQIAGHSPATSPYTPIGIPEGNEKYYILLPRSELNKSVNEKRNGILYSRIDAGGLLEVGTIEAQEKEPYPGLIYYFDSTLTCVRLLGNDYFVAAHKKLLEEGKTNVSLEKQYEILKQGLRYWDWGKFVEKPTINRRYTETSKK